MTNLKQQFIAELEPLLVEDRAPFGQPFERADLIGAHEAAVAFDICCKDRD